MQSLIGAFTLGECQLACVEFIENRGVVAVGRVGLVVGFALANLTVVGCSDMDPATDTFTLLNGGAGGEVREESRVANWECVGEPVPAPPSDIPETVTYEFPMVEWVSDVPLPSRTVQVCNKVDPMCAQPIQSAVVSIQPDERNVQVTMRGGQNVFLNLAATPEYLPETLWLDGPLYSDQTGGRIQLLSLQTVFSLAQSVSLPIDPTGMTGIVTIRAHDCIGEIASGAIYEINDTSATAANVYPYTFINGSPRGEPVPGTRTTIPSDSTPWAGFLNVRPGPLTVRGFLADTGQEFGSAETFVRAGVLSVVEVRPLDRL